MTSAFADPRALRVLHLEDNPNDSVLVLKVLRSGGLPCDYQCVANRADFEAALETGHYNLIIGDFTLPDYDGASALAVARKIQPDTPFIFVSGTIGEEKAVQCLRDGATDYVLKQRLERLLPAVQRALREAEEHLQRRRAENELKKSEERFREVADTIREVFWSTSPDGDQLLYGSPAYEVIWRRSPGEWRKRPASRIDTVVPEDRARVVKALEQLRQGTSCTLEYRIAWPDGTIRWIEERGYPVNNLLLGKVERIVGVAIDISDRKELEEQLHQAQKMEAVGQLAGGIAHDFNNMLTVINGRSQLLLDNPSVPPNVSESIRDIFIAGERAARLTRQLLVFSRKQFMHNQVVDLNEVTTDVARMLRSMIGEHVELKLELSREVPAVSADASMLEQVLMNLAVNGRDAMPHGGQLVISTRLQEITLSDWRRHPDSNPGPHVCLEVRDGGCGIPPETLPRIFEPFFTTKEVGKGTGLGLSTVFGIVKHHHGWIEVESKVGQGTVFKVFLPLVEEGIAAEAPAIEAKVAKGMETILLVEDEAPVRDFASAVLSQYGYRVLQAASGVAALEVWRWHADKISLLLTDLVMPDELTGIELAKKLQAAKPTLKVIFASGYSAEGSGPGFSSLKGHHFLHKPYPPRTLAQMVRDVLDEGKPVSTP